MTVPSLTVCPSGSDGHALPPPASTGNPDKPGFHRGSVSKKPVNNVSEIRNGSTATIDETAM